MDPSSSSSPSLSRQTNRQAINKGGRDRVQGKLASQQAFMSRTAQHKSTPPKMAASILKLVDDAKFDTHTYPVGIF